MMLGAGAAGRASEGRTALATPLGAPMRLPDPEHREFHGRLAATGRWISREPDRRIGSRLFERVDPSRQAGERAPVPADVFKDPRILDFPALGTDFCFVACQRRPTIDGEDDPIDLVPTIGRCAAWC